MEEKQLQPKKKSLHDLVAYSNHLVEILISQDEGDTSEEVVQTLVSLENQIANKVDSYVYVTDRLKVEAEYMKEKAKEFSNAARVLTNAADRIKLRVKEVMRESDMTEIKGEDFRLKLTPTKPRLVLGDMEDIREDYKVEVIVKQIDKDKIVEALMAGLEVEGAHFEESFALRKYVNKSNGKQKAIKQGRTKDEQGKRK